MRLLKAAFEEHYGHQAKDELEREDVGKSEEADETWLVEIGMLATLLILVAFSQEHCRHEGKDEREIEDVKNEQEEEEAWTSDIGHGHPGDNVESDDVLENALWASG